MTYLDDDFSLSVSDSRFRFRPVPELAGAALEPSESAGLFGPVMRTWLLGMGEVGSWRIWGVVVLLGVVTSELWLWSPMGGSWSRNDLSSLFRLAADVVLKVQKRGILSLKAMSF